MAPGLTEAEWQAYRSAGEIVRALKRETASRIRPGVTFLELATRVEESIALFGARPAFPCNISVNHIASHDTPCAGDIRVFRRGDVVKIDLGVVFNGYIADSAFTVEIETDGHRQLIAAAKLALDAAISAIKPGIFTSEVGGVIEASAGAAGFRVLRELFGHDLRRNCLHGGLTIPCFDDGSRKKIRAGDVLAIEPFLTAGSGQITRQPSGNIYQVIRPGLAYARTEGEKVLLAEIVNRYGAFPFAGRWVEDQQSLRGLEASAAIKMFPRLVEIDHEPVAQAEHTVIVGESGCITIT